jgi:hypothetical protein
LRRYAETARQILDADAAFRAGKIEDRFVAWAYHAASPVPYAPPIPKIANAQTAFLAIIKFFA